MDFQDLWVEKWRPKKSKDILLSKELREFIDNIEKSEIKNIPHLMLYGPPGCGKTTIAKVIVNDILQVEHLYINASDQNGIETVRGIITNFIQTKSFDGTRKVVLLDEFDGFSSHSGGGSSAQQSLRNMMEEYSNNVRFILTCNYVQKVIEPIWSRVQSFYVQPELIDFQKRCLEILKAENVQVPAESKVAFFDLIKDTYPDLRKCLNELQKCSTTGVFKMTATSEKHIQQIITDYWSRILSKQPYNEIRKYIIDNEKMFKGDYNVLLKVLFEFVYQVDGLTELQKKKTMLIISEAMYLNNIVMDKEINFFAMTLKIIDY
jgi:DNA polymerase III delta prime subunit